MNCVMLAQASCHSGGVVIVNLLQHGAPKLLYCRMRIWSHNVWFIVCLCFVPD